MATGSQLTPGVSSGSQSTTEDPQSSTSGLTLNGQTGQVQTGTASSLLTSTGGGILLNSTNTSSSAQNTSTSSGIVPVSTTHHTFNPLLLTVAIVLFVIAVIMFMGIARSAKSTTN